MTAADVFDWVEWRTRGARPASGNVVRLVRFAGAAPATVNRRVAAVRALFEHQVVVGARAENPVPAPRRGQGLRPTSGATRVRAHRLRHTYDTELAADAGIDLLALRGLMGHSSPETTAGYVPPLPGRPAGRRATVGCRSRSADARWPSTSPPSARRVAGARGVPDQRSPLTTTQRAPRDRLGNDLFDQRGSGRRDVVQCPNDGRHRRRVDGGAVGVGQVGVVDDDTGTGGRKTGGAR